MTFPPCVPAINCDYWCLPSIVVNNVQSTRCFEAEHRIKLYPYVLHTKLWLLASMPVYTT
jgi:hypothetical protein